MFTKMNTDTDVRSVEEGWYDKKKNDEDGNYFKSDWTQVRHYPLGNDGEHSNNDNLDGT